MARVVPSRVQRLRRVVRPVAAGDARGTCTLRWAAETGRMTSASPLDGFLDTLRPGNTAPSGRTVPWPAATTRRGAATWTSSPYCLTQAREPTGTSAGVTGRSRGASGRSRSASSTRSTQIHITVEPSMWAATRTSGRWVKYWT